MHLGLAKRKAIYLLVTTTLVFLLISFLTSERAKAQNEPVSEEMITEGDSAEESETDPDIESALSEEAEGDVPTESDATAEVAPPPEIAPEEALPIDGAAQAQIPPTATDVEENNEVSSGGELTYAPDVEVEKSVYYNQLQTKDCDCKYTYLMPYKKRRSTWGTTIGVGYSTYFPDNYKPDFVVDETMESYYGYAEGSLIDLTIGIKWNMGLGAISFDIGGGYYRNEGRDDSVLTAIPARAALTYTMDTIFNEPYVVPYASFGGYSVIFSEKLASQKKEGNTPIGLYWAAGLQFQLNWLDEDTALISYDETGLENTYLFAEARSFMESNDLDDFSSDPQIGVGLKVEY